MFYHPISKVGKGGNVLLLSCREATYFPQLDAQYKLFYPERQVDKMNFGIMCFQQKVGFVQHLRVVIGYMYCCRLPRPLQLSHSCARTPPQLLQQKASEKFIEAIL